MADSQAGRLSGSARKAGYNRDKNLAANTEARRCFRYFPRGDQGKAGGKRTRQDGVALFAYKTKRPVVPVGISTKDQKRRLFRRVYVNFGTPITFEEFAFADGGAQELQRASNMIMERVHDLMGQGR